MGEMGSGAPAIVCRGLEKTYPPNVRAVRGIDLDVPQGECFGLLGPNGAGKTTTVEILEGLLEPTAGDVEILGHTWRKAGRSLRQRIGISLQETRLPEKVSAMELVRLFRSFYADGMEPIEAIHHVGLEEISDTWTVKMSGGQRQRLEIACALVGRPELLFLDEPTTGLDPAARRQLWDVIRGLRAEGRTVVLTTHYMDEAEKLCDRVAIVDHGKIIAKGSPAELIASVGGDHVVEFSVDGADVGVGTFAELEGVRDAREEADLFALTVAEPHVVLPTVLDAVAEAGGRLGSVTTRHATLEDVFLHITGRTFEQTEEGEV